MSIVVLDENKANKHQRWLAHVAHNFGIDEQNFHGKSEVVKAYMEIDYQQFNKYLTQQFDVKNKHAAEELEHLFYIIFTHACLPKSDMGESSKRLAYYYQCVISIARFSAQKELNLNYRRILNSISALLDKSELNREMETKNTELVEMVNRYKPYYPGYLYVVDKETPYRSFLNLNMMLSVMVQEFKHFDINIPVDDDGNTTLSLFAKGHASQHLIRGLIACGADVNIANKFGMKPIHMLYIGVSPYQSTLYGLNDFENHGFPICDFTEGVPGGYTKKYTFLFAKNDTGLPVREINCISFEDEIAQIDKLKERKMFDQQVYDHINVCQLNKKARDAVEVVDDKTLVKQRATKLI